MCRVDFLCLYMFLFALIAALVSILNSQPIHVHNIYSIFGLIHADDDTHQEETHT